MGWLVARTDLPLAGTIRALVTASFVTPPFLGAIAWEILAAPNSGLINQLYRCITGAPQDEHLFNIYSLTGLIFVISCYTFPYVFVLVANALDRIPGDLEDASAILGGRTWTTARRMTIPLALPALLAGALVAFLQAMILFGSPAILALPAGFHTMTTKIWSLFQYPPKPELAAAAVAAAAGAHCVPAARTALHPRPPRLFGGRRQAGEPRLVKLGWITVAGARLRIRGADAAGVPAVFRAVQRRVLADRDHAGDARNATLHNIYFTFFELSSTKLALKNTFILGALAATLGTLLALVIAYLTARKAVRGHRALALPRHRADRDPRHRARRRAVPELYPPALRALRHAVDPADRLHHHRAAGRLSAVAVGVPLRASRARGREPHPRRHAAAGAAPRHRAAPAHQRDRDLVLHLRRR